MALAGFYKNKNRNNNASHGLLQAMSSKLLQVQGDSTDHWNDDFLGIVRTHHGLVNIEKQPIFNSDRTLAFWMDGEVYDYQEQKLKLIQAGHKFHFEMNDAEFCLHLYEEMGQNAFKELNGSFCLVFYNLITHELLLVNDRVSSRPLFYYLSDKGTLFFATQLSAILQSPDVKRELDSVALFEFFTFSKTLGLKTFLKNISILPPATLLHHKDGKVLFVPYWEMKYKEGKYVESYYVDKLAEALKQSIKRRTQGNYRYGLLLSGGLDARTVLAASDKKMTCFTIGDFENREVRIARRIAKAKGCKHIFLKRNPNHYVDLIDEAVEIGDGRYSFDHAHNIGLFHDIRKECDILLHAHYFDLLFKGWGLPNKKIFFQKPVTYREIIDAPNANLFKQNPEQLFAEPFSAQLKKSILASINEILTHAQVKQVQGLHRAFDYFLFQSAPSDDTFLYTSHNRTYTTERTVALDNDLINWYLETPINLRVNAKIFKKAVKKINLRIASIPDANTGFFPALPELPQKAIRKSLRIMQKLGFISQPSSTHPAYTQGSWPNFAELIRYNIKMKHKINDTINDPSCLPKSIFNITRINELFKEHLDNRADHTQYLFLLLTFGNWHKRYGPEK